MGVWGPQVGLEAAMPHSLRKQSDQFGRFERHGHVSRVMVCQSIQNISQMFWNVFKIGIIFCAVPTLQLIASGR